MAVRFKFRSSANFDSVDIGGPSVSVRDLKSKIIRHKNLDICQDLDLLFSDALTGQEYTDEKFQIPSGSSVIIKRVPAGSVPSNMANFNSFETLQNKVTRMVSSTLPANIELDNFDDFGVDLYPVPEATLSCADLDTDKNACTGSDEKSDYVARCSKPCTEGYQKLEESDLSEAIPRVSGPAHGEIEGNMSQEKPTHKVEEDTNIEKVVDTSPPAMQNVNLPSELKCSLCDSFFKEAVMIPCCQHSFCQKCIRLVLLEKTRCPKCFSTRCRVDDLLPNVSLRQAIEHFLESQILTTGSGTAFHQYAPDGESGIQAKDVSCGVSIFQRELEPHSPSTTGRGSNQNMVESAYDLLIRNNASTGGNNSRVNVNNPLKAPHLPHKINQHGSCLPVDMENRHGDLAAFDDFQGESQPTHFEDRDRTFLEIGRHKKGDRTCYMCGSPDHFVRDCPAASSPHQRGSAMFPGVMQGYARPFWNGTPLSHIRPYGNLYCNAGMMPFNATMVPAAPYAVPTYMPSMYGGFPGFSGYVTMGAVAPQLGGIEKHHLSHQEYVDFQNFEKRQKISNENRSISLLTRKQSLDDRDDDDNFSNGHPYNETERSYGYKSCIKREKSVSYSNSRFTQRSQRKNLHDYYTDHDNSDDDRLEKSSHSSIAVRDRRSYHHLERSSSEVEDMPSCPKLHRKKRHKYHHRSSKKHSERIDKCGSDSSRSHHQTHKEKEVDRKRNRPDDKRHNYKCHSHTESGVDQSLSIDQKRRQKESSHTSRHSKHNPKSGTDNLSHDRWQMVSGSDKDSGEQYHSCKRKRVH
ncbi:E3 ubiquitin ligase PQT3-like isoform X3 [Alnus glutinosa]|uniref:E3 ubiquitin ligase PQT3-like isoform X3 n=1 Tax=Alnus glutinosa TaxID=3517 RepID=UPI002D76AB0B|nr:E3 ubiquitin ligase PQT3-like isoform X3 [Alnus glutinosa]